MHGASPWADCAPVHDLVDFCFPLRLWMVRTLWWRSAEPVRPRQLPLWRKVITKQWILLKISVEKTFIHKVICLRSLHIWENPHLHHSILWPFVCLWQLCIICQWDWSPSRLQIDYLRKHIITLMHQATECYWMKNNQLPSERSSHESSS